MFGPYASAPSRPEGWLKAARICFSIILILILPLPGSAHAGSPWERETGERKERALPRIPQVREAVNETADHSTSIPRPAPVVALLDFDSTTLSTELQDAFAQALWAEFYASPDTRVLPRKELRRFLFAWDLYPQQPVGRQVSVAQTARALKADYLIHGHLNLADGAAMLDYRVYSAALDGIVTKNKDIRTGSLRDMALLIPEIAGSMLAAIQYAEGESASAFESASADRTQLLAEPEPAFGRRHASNESEDSAPALEPSRDPRAEAAAAEREQARRLEEAHRKALSEAADSTGATVQAGTEGPSDMPVEDSAAGGQRLTELAMNSPSQELVPVGPSGKTASTTRVNLEPVRPASSTADKRPHSTRPETATMPGRAAEASPEEAAIRDETPEAPDDLNSRDSARESFQKSRSLPAGDTAARIGLLEQAVALDPTEVDYVKTLALSYYKAGRYHDCIDVSREAARLAPEDSIVQTILGSALFESGRFEEARSAHARALELDASNLYARFNLALTLQAQGSPRALEAWSEFLELSEDVPAQARNRERALEYYDDLKAVTR